MFEFFFLVRSWNSFQYFDRCINSILLQKSQKPFTIIFIDDCSDYTQKQKKYIKDTLKNHLVIFNRERKFSVRNAYEVIHHYIKHKNSIVINVDGDDWLIKPNVIEVITPAYKAGNLLTYGNCIYHAPNQIINGKTPQQLGALHNQRYSQEIEENNHYRKYPFLPLHLRTWRADAYKRIPKHAFLRPNGDWLSFCEDQAIFLPMLEMAKGKYSVISEILYSYNVESPYNDEKINLNQKLFDEVSIMKSYPHFNT